MIRFCFDPSGWLWAGALMGFILCAAIRTTRNAWLAGRFGVATFLILNFAIIVMMAVKAAMEACS